MITEEDGIPIALIKYRCEGLTMEQWNTWVEDPTIVATAVNQKLTRIELPDDDGHKVRLLKMQMPMVISNRSTMSTFYRRTLEDGTEVVMNSSRGNEGLVEANADQIGSDVVTNNVITYMSYKPYETGIYITHILKVDPCGMIPDFIKKSATKRITNTLHVIVNYCQTGAIPEPMF